jgi:hypothetical protein
MKNIFLIETSGPRYDKYLVINKECKPCIWDTQTMGSQNTLNPLNIYITSDEEIKEGDWVYDSEQNYIRKLMFKWNETDFDKKIILTTDPDLIADGVQAIDNEFLEWFVENPSCENVEIITTIVSNESTYKTNIRFESWRKEESKQETLEEAAENYSRITLNKNGLMSDKQVNGFIAGAKWQSKRMYSEEEVGELVYNIIGEYAKHRGVMIIGAKLNELFEKYKKKS